MRRPVFNRTNENVDWARWTWNPGTGCLHGCPYCYARDIANRFYGEMGKTQDYQILNHLGPEEAHKPFAPRFWPDRLEAPFNTRAPRSMDIREWSVFVCSMADLFGEWVPREWIDEVLETASRQGCWNYIFLTKNPERYLEIDPAHFPPKCLVGATADTQDRAQRALAVFKKMNAAGWRKPKTFLSCEPLLERINFQVIDLAGYRLSDLIDWIIIGSQSRTSAVPALQPEWEWVEKILVDGHREGLAVYFKPNLTVRPREYPA